jgi:hypothetical protein
MTMMTMTSVGEDKCGVPACERGCVARGLCSSHYYHWSKAGKPTDATAWALLARPIKSQGVARLCKVEGCPRPLQAKGYCHGHYVRSRGAARSVSGVIGAVDFLKLRQPQMCEIRECDQPARCSGLCKNHYNAHRATKYIDTDVYNAAYDKQAGVCPICKQKPPPMKGRLQGLNADHNHETGVFRGLLCHCCNLAIGLLKDDPEVVQAAADYLRQP